MDRTKIKFDKVKIREQKEVEMILDFQKQDEFDRQDPCAGCMNNPKNGGSGVCSCGLPNVKRSRYK